MRKRAVVVMVTLVALVAGSSSVFAMEDSTENRSREAERYLSVVPPKKMFKNVAQQMARNYPPDKREMFIKVKTQYLDIDALVTAMKKSMVHTFSADELAAMADFYGSPAGVSAMKKKGIYMAEIMPIIQSEALQAIAEANRDSGLPVEQNQGEQK